MFDYEILFEDSELNGNLVIIYGENGSGKTTFLHAINHLLTPGFRHETALAEAQISQLEVVFRDKSSISYRSTKDSNTLTLTAPDGTKRTRNIPLENDNELRPQRIRRDRDREYFLLQREHSTPVTLVTDDRSVIHGGNSRDNSLTRGNDRYSYGEWRELAAAGALAGFMRDQELHSAVEKATNALKNATLRGVTTGDGRAEDHYVRVMRDLGKPHESLTANEAREALSSQLESIIEQGRAFSKYGLVALEQVHDIRAHLQDMRKNDAALPIIQRVVGPYLESLDVRMESLREAYEMIDSYITAINSFLTRKTTKFTVESGVTITLDSTGEEMSLSSLSSGEKHLLLLISYAVAARNRGGLFIVDEPELSLGLEWRRNLVPALLRCAGNNGPQFLLASHAIEIIAEFEERVVNPSSDRGSKGVNR